VFAGLTAGSVFRASLFLLQSRSWLVAPQQSRQLSCVNSSEKMLRAADALTENTRLPTYQRVHSACTLWVMS
jgi:hypothetical protein